MATLKDVANLAGVSIATVSNYLNNTKPVSKEISKKIQDAVNELHYSINQNAKNLKSKTNTDIGVILPSLNDSYYVQLFQGIKSYFQNTNYYLNLDFSENIPESEKNIVHNLLKKQVCGLILVSCQPMNWKFYYDNFTSKNIPLVLIDRNIHSLDANFVSFNNRILLRNMIESLLQSGFTDIYLMSGPESYGCEFECIRGFCDAFKNYNLSPPAYAFFQTDRLYETIVEKYRSNNEQPYDVFMYDIPWLPSLASEQILEDITTKFHSINPDIFLPNCLKYYSIFNGRYYGIPFMYAPQIFYYRKDLFENTALKNDYERENNISLRPPSTLKEFNTIADFFTNKTTAISYGISIPTAYSECLTPEIYMRLRSYGGSLFNRHGNVCLDSDHSLKAYINFVKSIKNAKPDYRTATDISVVDDFLKGETAMLISYPSFLSDVTDLRKNSIVGSIGYHLIPGHSPLLGGWGLGINSHSDKKQEAFEFLKWTCDEQITNYSSLLGGLSALNSTYTNDELTELYPWLPLYHSIYKYTKPTIPPKLSNNKVIPQYEIDAVVCDWIYKLLDSEIDVQQAITNTHLELESLRNTYLNDER